MEGIDVGAMRNGRLVDRYGYRVAVLDAFCCQSGALYCQNLVVQAVSKEHAGKGPADNCLYAGGMQGASGRFAARAVPKGGADDKNGMRTYFFIYVATHFAQHVCRHLGGRKEGMA